MLTLTIGNAETTEHAARATSLGELWKEARRLFGTFLVDECANYQGDHKHAYMATREVQFSIEIRGTVQGQDYVIHGWLVEGKES